MSISRSNEERANRLRRLRIEEAARLYSTSPEKIRRRLRRGELRSDAEAAGPFAAGADPLVVVDVEQDGLSSPQAARLLGVGSPTIRRDVSSGRLRGSREGRDYQIPFTSILADRRCPQDARQLLEPDDFTSLVEQPAAAAAVRRYGPPVGKASVPIYVRLRPEEAQALAVGVERYGSQRAAVGAALAQLGESLPYEAELRRLQQELDREREQARTAREQARTAQERLARLPQELYCEGCRSFVPLEELAEEESREHGGQVLVHRHDGLAALVQGGASRVLARRRG